MYWHGVPEVLSGQLEAAKLDTVAAWAQTLAVREQSRRSIHVPVSALPPEISKDCDRAAEKLMRHLRELHPAMTTTRVPQMDELAINGHDYNQSSDAVFRTPHIDGPFAICPMTTLVRGILALDSNDEQISTIFPDARKKFVLQNGEFVMFDYNRTVHHISQGANTKGRLPRKVLKFHFVLGPWGSRQCLAYMCAWFNKVSRDSFVHSLEPEGCCRICLSKTLFGTTVVYRWLQKLIGLENLIYTTLWAHILPVSYNFVMIAIMSAVVSTTRYQKFRRDVVLWVLLLLFYILELSIPM